MCYTIEIIKLDTPRGAKLEKLCPTILNRLYAVRTAIGEAERFVSDVKNASIYLDAAILKDSKYITKFED